MTLSRKTLAISLIAVLILIVIAGVLFFYESIQQKHNENQALLQKFGFQIVPSNPYTESTGELGEKQLPATFAAAKLEPADKVIKGLMDERTKLLDENAHLKTQIEQLKQQVASLEQYKQTNKQFAPKSLEQQLHDARGELLTSLRNLPEARRFSNSRLDLMATAGIREYRLFIDKNPTMIDAAQRQQIIDHDLLNYSFCVGKAVDLAANSVQEQQQIAAWFESPAKHPLSGQLRSDMDVVLPPCQIPLRKKLEAHLTTPAG